MASGSASGRMAAVVAATTDAIVEVARSGLITSWSPAAERLFGYGADDVVGTSIGRLLADGTEGHRDKILAVARGERDGAAFEATARPRTGPETRVGVSVAAVRTARGRATGAMVAVRRLRVAHPAAAKLAIREARYRALIARASEAFVIVTADGVLTYVSPSAQAGGYEPARLVGRQVFDLLHDADRMFARAAVASFAAIPGAHRPIVLRGIGRNGEIRWWRVLVTSLPDDPAVRGLAAVVQDFTRQKALEDELAGHRDDDADTGRPTRGAGRRAVPRSGGGDDPGSRRSLATPAGVAAGEASDADVLVRDAERDRLARAGVAGGPPPSPRLGVARRRGTLARELAEGLSEDRLALELQPIIRLNDGVPAGTEALLRWRAPDGTVLPPSVVLPTAGEYGMLPTLGGLVLRAACVVARSGGRVGEFVSVNVSVGELAADGFVARVRDALEHAGLPPDRLVLEIADTTSRPGVASHARVVEQVADLGVRIALDQFGTERGSLAVLTKLPISIVKIDREFVSELGIDASNDAVAASLLNLAAAIGVDAVAVGVETPEQRLVLARLGCVLAQGHLLDVTFASSGTGGTPDARGAARSGRRDRGPARPVDVRAIARIRSLLREGASLDTIAAALNRDGISHPSERRWHPRAVARVIASIPELSSRDTWKFL